MKAEEAKNLADQAKLNGYDEIVIKIKKSAAAGERRLLHYKPELSSGVIKKLREDGFIVEAGHDRDGYLAIINW